MVTQLTPSCWYAAYESPPQPSTAVSAWGVDSRSESTSSQPTEPKAPSSKDFVPAGSSGAGTLSNPWWSATSVQGSSCCSSVLGGDRNRLSTATSPPCCTATSSRACPSSYGAASMVTIASGMSLASFSNPCCPFFCSLSSAARSLSDRWFRHSPSIRRASPSTSAWKPSEAADAPASSAL